MSSRERLVLAVILAVAFALRLAVLLELRDDVLFEHPVLDEQRYVESARALAAGGSETRPHWQPPGIEYALAATFRVAGPGLLVPRLFQALLSVASCGLLFLVGRRLFGVRVGLAAAAILAVHGAVVYEVSELLPPTWALALDLLALHLLLIARERTSLAAAAGAGVALGASTLFAPTILPFALVAAWWLRRPPAIAALAAGVVLVIAPVTVRNAKGGELVLVSTNGGLNLHLGNNPDYRATFSLRPGRRWEELTEEPRRHGVIRPGAASAYFRDRALAFWAAHPLDAAALHARKSYLFWHGAEIARDTDLYAARDRSRVLAVLVGPRPWWWPGALLMPAALLGLALAWPERRRLALPLGFVAVQAVLVPLFFVTSRHRLPTLPLLALFAAAGGATLWQRWPTWRPPVRAATVGAVVALAVALAIPTWETRLSFGGELDFYRGLALRDAGRNVTALAALERATRAAPDDPRIWFELGNTFDTAGRPADAVPAWQRAAALDPWDSRPRRRVAVVLTRLGDLDGAAAALEATLAAAQREPAHYAPDHLNLALLYARRGDPRAAAAVGAAVAADPAYAATAVPRFAAALLGDPAPGDPTLWRELAAHLRRFGAADLAAACDQRAGAP